MLPAGYLSTSDGLAASVVAPRVVNALVRSPDLSFAILLDWVPKNSDCFQQRARPHAVRNRTRIV